MKKIYGLCVLLLFTFVLVSCQKEETPNTWIDIEERGYFIVGLDDTFAPMGFRDKSGTLVGFDVDLAKEVSKRLGVEVRFQPIDWDAKVLELNSGTIDMIWNGLTITESRLEEMSFSNPYLANSQIIMVKKGSNIKNMDDIKGKTVGVQISSASDDAVTKSSIFNELGGYERYDTFNQALIELSNLTIDAIVIDEIMGRYIISQNPNQYEVLSDDFGKETYGIGFRLESTDIRDKFNDVLNEMIKDGTATLISENWFDEDIFLR
jgi:polar amino acid transport system substrate-binding protein